MNDVNLFEQTVRQLREQLAALLGAPGAGDAAAGSVPGGSAPAGAAPGGAAQAGAGQSGAAPAGSVLTGAASLPGAAPQPRAASLAGAAPAVLSAVLAGADGRQLCAVVVAVEEVGRLVDALRTVVAGEVHERSLPDRGDAGLAFGFGLRRGWQLLERLTRVSPAEARRRTLLGAAARTRTALDGAVLPAPHPEVGAALAAGEIGLDSAEVVVRCLDQAAQAGCPDPADLTAAEEALVEAAAHSPAEEVGVQARAWREALDPDGAEPRDDRIRRRRAFRLGRERDDGLTPFGGLLAPVDAALLKAAFAEADRPGNLPRFLSDADRASGTVMTVDPTGETTVTLTDTRTREQRHYDVATGLLTAGARSADSGTGGTGPGGMRPTAQVTAVITLDDLRARTGIGWIDGITEPVSATTIERMVCAAGYAPILLGDHGEPLMLGRTRRLFSPAQLKALAVRDGGCVNCGAPPGGCDGHHIDGWKADDGPTDIDNGVLLCPECHTMIHKNDFTLRMIDGRPHILAPPWIDPDQQWRPLGRQRTRILTTLRTTKTRRNNRQ